jgi:D-3-phosphoglycerate dehydrogenase / 2-oxoglutarate reductase
MKILIASSVCPKAIERLHQHHDVLCAFGAKEAVLKSLIKDREVLVCRSGVRITAEVLECATELKLLVRAGSGTDNVDIDYLNERGIPFFRIAEPGAQAVAEMSFALMLALARNLMRADCLTRKGRWAKEELIGTSLTGKVLGIVGAGNIGTRVGELGAAWGMRPIGCVESPTPTIDAELRGKGIQLATFDEVVSRADFLSIHVPLSDSTHKLINADVFSRMKVGAFLINLARGGVLDEKALYKELTEATRLHGAALDVHESEGEGKISPLAALPNVILTPHIGAMTRDAQSEIGRRINAIIDSFMTSYPVLSGRESVLSFGLSHEGLSG